MYLSLRKIVLLQILQLVSGQASDDILTLDNIIKEEDINDSQKIWMDVEQEKQLASILDETKGWKKLAHHFNFDYLMNIFETSNDTTLLLLNYIAVRFSLFYRVVYFFKNVFISSRILLNSIIFFISLQIQTNTSLSELRNILHDIGEEDAMIFMDQVLSVKHEI